MLSFLQRSVGDDHQQWQFDFGISSVVTESVRLRYPRHRQWSWLARNVACGHVLLR
jgi:hypothetical protein